VIESDQFTTLKNQITKVSTEDMAKLGQLRKEVRSLGTVKRIKDFSATAISLVASDGGNNRLRFDPFEIHIIRIVDSYGAEACLKVVSRYSDINSLSKEQFNDEGHPITFLGDMMTDLGVHSLRELSPMLNPKKDRDGREVLNPSWVLVYRDLWEWAVLYDKFKNARFATDTIIVIDGLLRSKVFANTLFIDLINLIQKYISKAYDEQRRKLYLVGVAKHSKVLDRYRLAMNLEDILRTPYPAYVYVPSKIEELAYEWPEYTRRPEDETEGGERAKFVGGHMFLAKFGPRPSDPIWPVDILLGQEKDVENIMGYLKNDAMEGFPVPYYPRCIQKAHDYAAIVGLDSDIFQTEIIKALMELVLPDEIDKLEEFILSPKDAGGVRYA